MASAIELVDRMDHELSDQRSSSSSSPPKKGRYAYDHVTRKTKGGKKHDLFLKIEDGDGAASIASSATNDDYVGLESELTRRENKRKAKKGLVVLLFAILIGSIVYTAKSSSSSSSKTSVNGQSLIDDDDDDDDNYDPNWKRWPTLPPAPTFRICSPPIVADRHTQKHQDIFHIGEFHMVPEAPTKDDLQDKWEYTFSDMDMNYDANIIAVGMSDFSESTDSMVGLVRVFAYGCKLKTWQQLGQDLLGTIEFEQFGHKVSSSHDGTVMAISAPQSITDSGSGFVEVYYLNDNRWELLGQRIEKLGSTDDYSSLGRGLSLSPEGETLAVLRVLTPNDDLHAFTMRVFQYSTNKETWTRKGKDLTVTMNYDDSYDFNPQISLSEEGDILSVADPQIGVLAYHFDFKKNKWKKAHNETKAASWEYDDYYTESMDLDGAGNLIAFSGIQSSWSEDAPFTEETNFIKVIDFANDVKEGTLVYNNSFSERSDIDVSVSDNGEVAAIVASKYDEDDAAISGEYVGSMTVITKQNSTEGGTASWRVVGKGTKAENIGVSGNVVTLSGNGMIAAIGSDLIVGLYGIKLDSQPTSSSISTEAPTVTPVKTPTFETCTPFPNATFNSHAGDIDDLPKIELESTLSLTMSLDGAIVAVGIDSFDGENRGLVRVFAWSCASQAYTQLGQDLFGGEDFDGFGVSVALSGNGQILAVGANQPRPDMTGYVEIYLLDDDDGNWKLDGYRVDNVKNTIEDFGREVRISDDGSILMVLGSIGEEYDGYEEPASFIRVIENVSGEWIAKGDDLISSVTFDTYGHDAHISQSADGQTLGVTGSYGKYTAKVYTFDADVKNWTETVVPPLSVSDETYCDNEFDEYYNNYFSGSDIALNNAGNIMAVTGNRFEGDDEVIVVEVLSKDATSGNWTLFHNPVDYADVDWSSNSLGISGDGQKLVVGINTQSDNDQGSLYVTSADASDSGWNYLGYVDGREDGDLLGSRVSISGDGTLAAASSLKGYVSFFKIG